MSFGWSVGDLVAAVQLLVQVADALKEIDGAHTKYQEDTSYLLGLANVLKKVQVSSTDCGGSSQVEDLHKSVVHFQKRLHDVFEENIGKETKNDWWAKLKKSPRKIQYGLIVHKEVDELRRRIDIPLKSIIIGLEIENHELSRKTQNNVETLTALVSDLKPPSRDFAEVTNWLSPLAFDDVYERLLSTMSPGSCEWILQKDQFIDWLATEATSGRYSLLWTTGAAGYGKTRIATRVIQTLRNSRRIAYFYCDAQDGSKRSVIDVLRNWSWQLLRQDKSNLRDVVDIQTKDQLASEKVLETVLHAVLQSTRDTILILDAFDECEPKEQTKFYGLFSRISRLARILVFSRPPTDNFGGLKKETPIDSLRFLEILESDTHADINQFINQEIPSLSLYDESIVTEITSKLQTKAKGMFLWVALMMEELRRPQFDDSDYLESLNHLPENLDTLYCRILLNLPSRPRERDVSKLLLQLVLFAQRPLSLQEIGAAMKVIVGQRQLKAVLASDERLQGLVTYYCGSLISIQKAPDGHTTVALIHYTLKEYLISNTSHIDNGQIFKFEPEEAHGMFGRICLTYLCYENIEPFPFENQPENEEYQKAEEDTRHKFLIHSQRYPFLGYSACYWWWHIRRSAFDQGTHEALSALCTSNSNTIRWLQLLQRHRNSLEDGLRYHKLRDDVCLKCVLPQSAEMFSNWVNIFTSPRELRVPLNILDYYLCHWGLTDFLPEIHVASFFNMTEAVNQYLQAGVDVNQRSCRGDTPTAFASLTESTDCLKILIAHGADLDNVQNRMHRPPLFEAIDFQVWWPSGPVPYTSAHILIAAGANPSCGNGNILVRLCSQAFRKDPTCVSLVSAMLARGASMTINETHDSMNVHGLHTSTNQAHTPTALHWAARTRNMDLVRLLLSYGADVNAAPLGNGAGTTLIQACAVTTPNAEGIARILLDAKATITARRRDGRTALHLAARHPVMLSKCLLDAGAEVNVRSVDGCTPLHDAATENNQAMILLLLAGSASLNIRNAAGQTPLAAARASNNLEAAEILQKASGSTIGEAPSSGGLVISYPLETRDIFEAFSVLCHCTHGALPRHIILTIMDYAEYWLVARVIREQEIRVAQRDCEDRLPYLTSEPFSNATPYVRQIKFVVRSHDQGWSDFKANHGTFDDSWTWFESDFERQPGRTAIPCQGIENALMRNIHASLKYVRQEKRLSTTGSLAHKEWLESLLPGDRVSIVPMARFPGWANFVREALIEVYTTCLLPEPRPSE